ncbi:hypothetical protein PR202_gb03707 [Eleusine coracana subsp. coracana]|uniref:Protein kinase domain-containing protein n=1 Tax=Eleusine coracana subsp. coracana TaxID=191504 RepID=A0AAV5E2F7_ELECO|nr:hypothetical protein PR202_gb03707 [Eleusine coracana subsp. coracana]
MATPFVLMLLVLIGGGLALLPTTSSRATDMPMPVNEEVLGLVVFKSALSGSFPGSWRAGLSRTRRRAGGRAWSATRPPPACSAWPWTGSPCPAQCRGAWTASRRPPGPLPGPQQPLRPTPPGLSLLKSLRSLDLSHNAFSGPLPDDLAMLGSLRYLDLTANAFSGPLPDFFPSSLRFLMLADNQFAGPLPNKGLLAQNALLLHLNVSGNQLTGSPWTSPARCGRWTSACCPHLAAVDLSNNAFDGHLPDSIAQLSSLVRFSASSNRLSGDVPAWLGKLTALQRLDLSGNAFTGSLPESIGDLKALSYLGLSDNQLSGSVPDSIVSGGGWTCPGNRLTGGIPAGMLASSKMMRYLNLSHNDLRAQLPPEMGTLHDLTVLDLRNAGLYGEIPSDLCGSGSSLSVLQLDGNSLSGPIPDTIGKCSSLYLLSLGHNGLTGPIPAGVSELKKLEILRLEYNNLSGEIPAQLATLDNLLAVNISHNRLVGRLPSSGVFQSLDASALEGNLGICSPLVSEPCRMNVQKPLVLDPNEYTHGDGGTSDNNNGDNNLETTANGGVPRKRRVLSVSAMVAICAAVVIVVGVGVITLLNMSAARRHKEQLPTENEKGEKNHHRSTKAEELESGGGGVSNNYSGSSSSSTTKTKNKHNSSQPEGGDVRCGGQPEIGGPAAGGADALLSQAAEIGRGSFGTVYRASVGQGRMVAVEEARLLQLQ